MHVLVVVIGISAASIHIKPLEPKNRNASRRINLSIPFPGSLLHSINPTFPATPI